MTNHARRLLDIDEQTKIIALTDKISSRVPEEGRWAFVRMRDSLYNYQFIQSVALWDPPARNCNSIPTATLLLDDQYVLDALSSNVRTEWETIETRYLNPHQDSTIQEAIQKLVDEDQRLLAQSRAEASIDLLRAVIDDVKRVMSKVELTSLRNIRNHRSHILQETYAEERARLQGSMLQNIRIIDADVIQNEAIRVIQQLNLCVNMNEHNLEVECRELSRQTAEAFWGWVEHEDAVTQP